MEIVYDARGKEYMIKISFILLTNYNTRLPKLKVLNRKDCTLSLSNFDWTLDFNLERQGTLQMSYLDWLFHWLMPTYLLSLYLYKVSNACNECKSAWNACNAGDVWSARDTHALHVMYSTSYNLIGNKQKDPKDT